MNIPFTKMHAIGNDFIVINQLDHDYQLTTEQITMLADRHIGIGFDQMLIVENSQKSECDFKYRIFNADGSEVEHCGNGARCFYSYIKKNKLTGKKEITVEIMNNTIKLHSIDDLISVDMGSYRVSKNKDHVFPVYKKSGDTSMQGIYVLVSNPHIVFMVDKISDIDVEKTANQIQKSIHFPQSVNVGFCEIRDRDKIKLVVYERGSGQTLGCGSGACAATVAAIEEKLLNDSTIEILMPGGKIFCKTYQGNITLMGDANFVYEGVIDL